MAPNLDCPNIGGLLSSSESTMAALRLLFAAPKRENGVERSAPNGFEKVRVLFITPFLPVSYGVVDRIAAVPVVWRAPAPAPTGVMLAKERLPSFDSVPVISKSSSSSICCTFCDDGTNRRLGAVTVDRRTGVGEREMREMGAAKV